MSNLIVPDVAKVQQLKNQLQIPTVTTPTTLKLFRNSYTPDHTTVLANLTECDFTGYVAYTLSGGAVSGSLDGTGRAVASYTAHTFTKAGATGNTVYGYYVVDGAGALLWVEAFDAGIPLTVDGAFIQLTPKFTGMSQFSNT